MGLVGIVSLVLFFLLRLPCALLPFEGLVRFSLDESGLGRRTRLKSARWVNSGLCSWAWLLPERYSALLRFLVITSS